MSCSGVTPLKVVVAAEAGHRQRTLSLRAWRARAAFAERVCEIHRLLAAQLGVFLSLPQELTGVLDGYSLFYNVRRA